MFTQCRQHGQTLTSNLLTALTMEERKSPCFGTWWVSHDLATFLFDSQNVGWIPLGWLQEQYVTRILLILGQHWEQFYCSKPFFLQEWTFKQHLNQFMMQMHAFAPAWTLQDCLEKSIPTKEGLENSMIVPNVVQGSEEFLGLTGSCTQPRAIHPTFWLAMRMLQDQSWSTIVFAWGFAFTPSHWNREDLVQGNWPLGPGTLLLGKGRN